MGVKNGSASVQMEDRGIDETATVSKESVGCGVSAASIIMLTAARRN